MPQNDNFNEQEDTDPDYNPLLDEFLEEDDVDGPGDRLDQIKDQAKQEVTEALKKTTREVRKQIEKKVGEFLIEATSEFWAPVLGGCLVFLVIVGVIAGIFALGFLGYGQDTAMADEGCSIIAGEHTFPLQTTTKYSYADTWGDSRGGGTRSHQGTDIMADKHEKAVAVTTGKIKRAGDAGIGGRRLYLVGDDGFTYYYAHMNNDNVGSDDGNAPLNLTFVGGALEVAEGKKNEAPVKVGDVIAYVGDSGNAEDTAPHIHFGMKDQTGNSINPYPHLREWDPKKGGASTEIACSNSEKPGEKVGNWFMPVPKGEGFSITSHYGYRIHPTLGGRN